MATYDEQYGGTDAAPSPSRVGDGTQPLNQCSPPQCPVPGFDENYVIAQMFTYHPANMFTQPKFETIREAAKYFARVLLNNVPVGADRSAAIRKVREAMMTAN